MAVVVVALWMILSKAWIEALSTLTRRRPTGRRRARGCLLARGHHERRPVARDAHARRDRVRDRAARRRRDRRGAQSLHAARHDVRPQARRGAARGLRRGRARRRSCEGPDLVEELHLVHADRDHAVADPARPRPGRTSAGSGGQQAWQGWEQKPVVGTGAGSFLFTNERYRTHEPRRDDRAAQPAGAVPERDGRDRALAVLRLGRLAGRARPSAAGAAAGPRARAAGVLPARAARHRLGLPVGRRPRVPDRRGARGPARDRAAAEAVHAAHRGRVDRDARALARRGLARRPLGGTGRRTRSAPTTRRRCRSPSAPARPIRWPIAPLLTAGSAETNIAAAIANRRGARLAADLRRGHEHGSRLLRQGDAGPARRRAGLVLPRRAPGASSAARTRRFPTSAARPSSTGRTRVYSQAYAKTLER